MRTENGKRRTENGERKTENGSPSPFSILHSPLSVLRSPFSTLCSPFSILCFLLLFTSCAKVYHTATPTTPVLYRQTYTATPNAIYYALRWAFKTYGYPIAEEDLQHGVIKTRYVPVKAASHYVDVFKRKDFGVNGAYHQLEVRLLPHGSQTEIQIGSRIQASLSPIRSAGQEENLILTKVGDYLRGQNVQLTNQGISE